MSSCNGVDLRDIDRNFSPEEWRQLPNFVRDAIRTNRAQKKARRDEAQLRGVSPASTQNLVADETSTVTQSQQADSIQNTAGRSFGRNAHQGRGGGSQNRTNESSWLNVSTINSSIRRYVGSVNQGLSTTPDFVSTTEIDNHADTCCFGANFTPLYFTGQVCQVQPFIESYDSLNDVQICSAATAYDDPTTGATYILVFHQGLWFGPKLKHSLINPNQCRSFGISLCDDPFDPHRPLSIYDPISEFTIPLTMNGTICFYKSRTPRPNEIQAVHTSS